MLRSWLLLVAAVALLAPEAHAVPWPAECRGPLEPSVEDGCTGISHAGCCDPRGRVLYCKEGDLYCVDCAGQLPACGWTPFGHYDCGTSGAADPSGQHPAACPTTCDPSCTAASPCSPACPGPCGHCTGGRVCLEDGACHAPDCGDRACGFDAAGLSCGVCPPGTECVPPLFACLPLPAGCAPKRGPGCDGCACEACVCALYPGCCRWHWDAFCAAACELECGQACQACPAEPHCAPGQCGPFCGLDCGGCAAGQVCHGGACCTAACQQPDGTPRTCGPDGCGGSCGDCTGSDVCLDGACVPCQPACAGRQCGPDGCGGSCGDCPPPATCGDDGACLTPGSCWGLCGGPADGCYCDAACASYGDCCPDFCDACPVECATDPCSGVPAVGCCQGEVLLRCVEAAPQATDCAAAPFCGWDAAAGVYACGTGGGASKFHPKACPATLDAWVAPADGMGVPGVALALCLLLGLLGCSGDGGNERPDGGPHDTLADARADLPDDAGDPPDPGPDHDAAHEALDGQTPGDSDPDPGVPDPRDAVEPAPEVAPDAPEAGPEGSPDGAGPADATEVADLDAGGEVTEPYNCAHLPPGPLELEAVPGAIAAEDLAFDGEGWLIGSDMSAVYKSAPGQSPKVFVPNLQTRAGMRMIPSGFLAVNDDTLGRLLLFDATGALNRVLMQGLSYPNGMVVDLDGFVYVTEHNSGRVLRVHPYTGESTVIAEGLFLPNGIAFDPTYTRLYIGTFGGAIIWTMTLSRDGRPGRLEVFADLSDTPGELDGIGVDACGNVYVCEYGSTDIWRISPDGTSKVRIVDSDPSFTYLPNLQWGRGEGWDPQSIYVPDGWNVGVWRIQVGVPSAPQPFP